MRDLSAENRRAQAEAQQKPQRCKAAKKSQIITWRLCVFIFAFGGTNSAIVGAWNDTNPSAPLSLRVNFLESHARCLLIDPARLTPADRMAASGEMSDMVAMIEEWERVK